MINCEENGRQLRTFQGASVRRGSEEFIEKRQGECGGCADALQFKDSKEQSLDRTLSETFPCSDPLSSIPNPVAPAS